MKLLYFAWLREKAGIAAEEVTPPDHVTTVGELVDWLKDQSAGHADAFADLSIVRVAVNQEYVGLDQAVAEADEVAFFPPVTGG